MYTKTVDFKSTISADRDGFIMVFEQDENGCWSNEMFGPMYEADVIDSCKKATNWKEIRAKHFPMEGFSS